MNFRNTQKSLLCLISSMGLLLLSNSLAVAQLPVSGAGVWYNAEAINGVSNGAGVSVWSDLGSQGQDAVQTSDSSKQPTYVTDGVNGRPVLRFNGLNQDLKTVGNVTFTQPNQAYFVFKIVPTPGEVPEKARALFDTEAVSGTSARQRIALRNNPEILTNGWSYNAGESHVKELRPSDWGISEITVAGASSVWNRNGSLYKAANFGSRDLNGRLTIGSQFLELQDFYYGDIAEIIFFDEVLNSAEVTILNSHLSAKYAIPSEGTEYAGYGARDRDVFGIGRVDSSNELATGGLAGLSLSSSSLTDDSWLLAGHNNVTNGISTTGDAEHWTRTWYVDNTNLGSSSTVDFSFDFSDGGVAFDSGATYKLLYSATDSLSFSVASSSGIVAGDSVSFSLAGDLLADGYYTIGELDAAPTTPGDFDNDGDVDGRDFLVWQRNTSVGNLSDWQTNYGFGALTASVGAVPEPSSLFIVGSMCATLALRLRRRITPVS